MTARQVLQVFDTYQKARISFAQMIAELATKPHLSGLLSKAKVLELLKPLLTDVCPQIQQCACVALGRLVYNDPKLAKLVLNDNTLPILLRDIHVQNKYLKKSILFVIRGLCKHDVESAAIVVNNGGLQALVVCLEDFEIIVKESAVWALGYLARHSQSMAEAVVDAGAVPHLVLCMQEPELTLKQITANALADIAKHSVDTAQAIVDSGAVPYLAKNLNNQDEKLKRQILTALASIAIHSNELAEMVVEARIFPTVLIHLAHPCAIVRRNAASLVRDIVKHSIELAQLVSNNGGVGALLEILGCEAVGEAQIPALTALGYIAGQSDQIALSVIGCNGILTINQILQPSSHPQAVSPASPPAPAPVSGAVVGASPTGAPPAGQTCGGAAAVGQNDDTAMAAAAWAIGQIGKHSPEHARAVAQANIFPRLLELHLDERHSSEDLRTKSKNALKQCLQKCLVLSALEPLIYEAPPTILKYVLGQFSKVLPNDPKSRRLFVSSGGLKKLQEIEAEPGSTLMEYISIINSCFPEEIVRFYSPNYPETILEQVEQYSPQLMNILRETKHSNAEMQTDVNNMILNKTNLSEDLLESL